MSDKQTNQAKSAFLWHIAICCGPIIVLSLVGTGTVLSSALSGPILLIVGTLFLVLIAILLHRAANRPESAEKQGASAADDLPTRIKH
jgi:threonine/homoserine/homoserine lactone efflux protein